MLYKIVHHEEDKVFWFKTKDQRDTAYRKSYRYNVNNSKMVTDILLEHCTFAVDCLKQTIIKFEHSVEDVGDCFMRSLQEDVLEIGK